MIYILRFQFLLMFIFLFTNNGIAFAKQDSLKKKPFDILDHTMALATPRKAWTFKHHVNIELVSLPKDWLESALSIPFPGYKLRFHLPIGFSIDASIHSIVIASQIKFGPKYLINIGQFHAGIGLDGFLNIGWLNGYGFDNSVLKAWQIEPNLSIGVHFDNMALTLEGRYRYLTDYQISTGSLVYDESRNVFNGFTASLNIEQRLFKNQVMLMGISLNYARFHILAWPVFNPVKSLYYMPQFNIGMTF